MKYRAIVMARKSGAIGAFTRHSVTFTGDHELNFWAKQTGALLAAHEKGLETQNVVFTGPAIEFTQHDLALFADMRKRKRTFDDLPGPLLDKLNEYYLPFMDYATAKEDPYPFIEARLREGDPT